MLKKALPAVPTSVFFLNLTFKVLLKVVHLLWNISSSQTLSLNCFLSPSSSCCLCHMSCRNRLQREIILNQFFQMNPVCCLLDLVPPTSLPLKTNLFKDGPISKSTMITYFWTNWVVNHKVSNLSHGSSWSEPRGGVTHVHDAHYFLITCASPLHIHSMLNWIWIKSQRCIFKGVFSKVSGNLIVVPNFRFLS